MEGGTEDVTVTVMGGTLERDVVVTVTSHKGTAGTVVVGHVGGVNWLYVMWRNTVHYSLSPPHTPFSVFLPITHSPFLPILYSESREYVARVQTTLNSCTVAKLLTWRSSLGAGVVRLCSNYHEQCISTLHKVFRVLMHYFGVVRVHQTSSNLHEKHPELVHKHPTHLDISVLVWFV